MNWITIALMVLTSFWIGYAIRSLQIAINALAYIQELEKVSKKIKPIHDEIAANSRFAEPLTTAEIAAREEHERLQKLNPDIKL